MILCFIYELACTVHCSSIAGDILEGLSGHAVTLSDHAERHK